MSKWQMVRIAKRTHAKLLAIKERFDNAETLPVDLDRSEQDRFGVSIAAIVEWLILQEEKHRERSKKPRKPSTNGTQACQSYIESE